MNVKQQEALITKFRAVTAERLGRLNNALLQLEATPDDETLVLQLAREIHTLKGEAMLIGFRAIARVAHKSEELLPRARQERFAASSTPTELLLIAFDAVAELRQEQPESEAADERAERFCARADEVLARRPSTRASDIARSPMPTASDPVRDTLRPARAHAPLEGDRSVIRVDIGKLDALADFVDEMLMSEAVAGQTLDSLRNAENSFAKADEELEQALSELAAGKHVDPSSLRNTLVAAVRHHDDGRKLLRDGLRKAREELDDERGKLEALETHVRDLRLLPLGSIFQVYPRAVRDLASQLGKKVRLETSGMDVEVDKQVLDRIDEPIVHLIRNSVDHGAESPAERVAARKPETAVVRLSAEQRGHQVHIQVSDDGRGIDVERVRALAVERGLLNEASAASLSNEELIELAFVAGFSTREEVTTIAGRGIGLDVVKREIEALGGSVTLESQLGSGTRCHLIVPVSLVRAPVLVFRLGDALYGVSSAAAEAVLHIDHESVRRIGVGRAIRYRDRLVPLVKLRQLLALPAPQSRHNGRSVAIVLAHGGRQVGCEVDEILHERHVIQRDLNRFASRCRLASGTAVGAHGGLIMLLSAPELVEAARSSAPAEGARTERPESRRRCILVVDDSELTRDMLVNLVRQTGHDIIEAVDGRDALEHMATRIVDLVITDLEMPVLDGFELLRELRAAPRMRNIPVVVCSTRGAEEDKRRAAHLGADAYLVKAQFSDRDLLEAVDRLLVD